MDRDFDTKSIPEPPIARRETPPQPPRSAEHRLTERPLSREHEVTRFRGHSYRVSAAERGTMRDIGRFRTVAIDDLIRYRYDGQSNATKLDLRSLRGQGLIQLRSVWAGPKSRKLTVAVLTKQGKALLKEQVSGESDQTLYSGFVKPAEVRHDAAIYRMYQAEKQKIERDGGRIRRLVLDYELKKNIYSPLARAKHLPPLEYARRQAEVARQNGLTVIDGKIPLPDLRIEYETQAGQQTSVDLELATGHYHGRSLAEKAEAGFKMYAAEGSGSRLSRALEEREITASILYL